MEEYIAYYCRMMKLIHWPVFRDTTKENWKHGWGEPVKMLGNIAVYYPGKNHLIKSYEDFKKN